MNARSVDLHALTREPCSDKSCPAEAIGQRLQLLDELYDRSDAKRPDGNCLADQAASDLQRALLDLDSALVSQLEWVRATTVRGLLVQFLAMESRQEDAEGLDGFDAERAVRSARRLRNQIVRSLIELGEVGPDELGLPRRWRFDEEFAEAAGLLVAPL